MTQLFDLLHDPQEQKDLAENAEYTATITRLRQEMSGFSKQWDDRQHPMGKAFWDRCEI